MCAHGSLPRGNEQQCPLCPGLGPPLSPTRLYSPPWAVGEGGCSPRDTPSPALESFLRGDPSPSPRPLPLLPLPGQDHQSVLSASFLPPTTEGARPSRNPARGAYLWLPAETSQQPGKCLPNCPNVLVLSAHAAPHHTHPIPHTPPTQHTQPKRKATSCWELRRLLCPPLPSCPSLDTLLPLTPSTSLLRKGGGCHFPHKWGLSGKWR